MNENEMKLINDKARYHWLSQVALDLKVLKMVRKVRWDGCEFERHRMSQRSRLKETRGEKMGFSVLSQ